MKRFASVRFVGVLGASERESAVRPYVSAGATVTSWSATQARTYVTLRGEAAALPVPPLAVVRATPAAAHRLPALLAALAGPGAPAGIDAAYRDGASLVIEFDPRRMPLALVVAAVDAELANAPGRTIEPLVPLDDETLAAFAGFVLGDPALNAARLVETYVEPLLAVCAE